MNAISDPCQEGVLQSLDADEIQMVSGGIIPILVYVAGVALGAGLVAGGVWIYRHM